MAKAKRSRVRGAAGFGDKAWFKAGPRRGHADALADLPAGLRGEHDFGLRILGNGAGSAAERSAEVIEGASVGHLMMRLRARGGSKKSRDGTSSFWRKANHLRRLDGKRQGFSTY